MIYFLTFQNFFFTVIPYDFTTFYVYSYVWFDLKWIFFYQNVGISSLSSILFSLVFPCFSVAPPTWVSPERKSPTWTWARIVSSWAQYNMKHCMLSDFGMSKHVLIEIDLWTSTTSWSRKVSYIRITIGNSGSVYCRTRSTPKPSDSNQYLNTIFYLSYVEHLSSS